MHQQFAQWRAITGTSQAGHELRSKHNDPAMARFVANSRLLPDELTAPPSLSDLAFIITQRSAAAVS